MPPRNATLASLRLFIDWVLGTGGRAWIVVAWDFTFDIPGKPEIAYGGQCAPRSAVRCLSSRFVFHHCLLDFQYTTDLADLGQVAFANCHAFHRNTHSSPSLNSSGWKRWHRTCMALNRHARSLFRSVSSALYRRGSNVGILWAF